MLVGIIGFWIGMSWVSGPLAWIMGSTKAQPTGSNRGEIQPLGSPLGTRPVITLRKETSRSSSRLTIWRASSAKNRGNIVLRAVSEQVRQRTVEYVRLLCPA
jgi:hypothetical protein